MNSRSPSELSRIALPFEGDDAREAFQLAPDRLHLNHGSFGALPWSVLAVQARWRADIERDATTFFDEVYPNLVRRMAAVAAERFGGEAKDWVLCENVTAALAGVLASLPLNPGDELLTTSHAYGAVVKAMCLWAHRRGATVKIAGLPVVLEDQRQVVDGVTAAFSQHTRLLVIDHITSPTAAVFPIAEIVRAARAAGIAVFVDGAHGPGQIPLDVPALGADWYAGNVHKWFFAPRGCGVLWTAPERQDVTRPAVLSHGTDKSYTDAFDWIGTRDATPWFCLEAAAQAFDSFGGAALMARNRQLAADAAAIVSGALGGVACAPAQMREAMAAICLPAERVPAEAAPRLKSHLRQQGVVVAANVLDGRLCLRLSAQIYNELSEYRRCAKVLAMDPFVRELVGAG